MSLNQKILWALKPEAKETIDIMVKNMGMDEDLAIFLLETMCTQSSMYDLPSMDEDEEDTHG